MKKVVIAAIAVVGAIIVALVVLLIVGISKGGFDMAWGLSAELRNRQTFSVEDIDTLMIDYSSDSIHIYQSDGDEIILEEYDTHWDESKAAVTSLNNGTLKITQGKRPIQIGIFIFKESYVNIYVPSYWYGDMDVSCTSGSIKAEDDWSLHSMSIKCSSGTIRLGSISADGDLTIKTTSGSIKSSALTANGKLNVHATSGTIKCTALSAGGSIKVTCNSGTITLEKVTGSFDVSTTSGGVRIGDVSGSGYVEANSGTINLGLSALYGDLSTKTTSGSIKITILEDFSFSFSASVGSGMIKTPFDDSLSYNKSGNKATGNVGGDPQYTLSCQAGSGTIRVIE